MKSREVGVEILRNAFSLSCGRALSAQTTINFTIMKWNFFALDMGKRCQHTDQ